MPSFVINKNIVLSNPGNQLNTLGFIGISNLVVEVTSAYDYEGLQLNIEYVDFGYYVNGISTILGRSNFTEGKASFDYGKIRREYVGELDVNNSSPMYLTLLVKGTNGSLNILNNSGCNVFVYKLPEVNKYLIKRDETDNTKAIHDIILEVSSIVNLSSELNIINYKRQYKNDVGEWVNIDTNFISINNSFAELLLNHVLPYLTDKSYQTRILLKDIFDNQAITYDTLPTSSIVMTWGKDGAGFGKRWEHGALDVLGDYWKNGILQPTLYKKKPSEPDPESMEDGDLLFIYSDQVAFSSTNFPLEFGESFIWGHNNTSGVWYTDFNYWTSLASSNNTLIESFEASTMKGDNVPSIMFVNDSNCYYMPDINLPAVIMLKFKGKVKFNYFNLSGWNQDHEPKNSPKSFAFFGSNDGHKWDVIYDTSTFADTYKTTVRQAISNANYYEYLKIVWRTNQDNNSGNITNATMIAVNKLSFEVEGYKYV